MTEFNSTKSPRTRKPTKPKKPHPDFPLTPHNSGRWCKKVRGKLHYFGPWADPQAALELWIEQKDDLLAGRVPRPKGDNSDGPTLRELVNKFLTTKKAKQDEGELSPYTFKAYHDISEHVISFFGKDRLLSDIRQEDFQSLRSKWAAKWGPVRLGSEINRAKVIFNFAFKSGIIDKPIRYGEGFDRPSQKVMLLHKDARGENMFEADELRRIIEAANQPLKAMILLGINAGFGNSDVGFIPMKAIDLERGWVTYPRQKTGVARRCPLWPETIAALREWLAMRPAPADEADANLVFLTCRGHRWLPNLKSRPLTNEMSKLLDRAKVEGRHSFYTLRHTTETIGGDSRDQIAVDYIMGHKRKDMASVYRERISDDRLRAVAEHVRKWLFSATAPEATQKGSVA